MICKWNINSWWVICQIKLDSYIILSDIFPSSFGALVGLFAVGKAERPQYMACILSSSSAPLSRTQTHLSSELVPTRSSSASLSCIYSFPLINISVRDRPFVPLNKVHFFLPQFYFRNSRFLAAEKIPRKREINFNCIASLVFYSLWLC